MWLLMPVIAFGQTFQERFEDWPLELKIRGRIVIANQLPADTSLIDVTGLSAPCQGLYLVDEPSLADSSRLPLQDLLESSRTMTVAQLAAHAGQLADESVDLLVWCDARSLQQIPNEEMRALESSFREHLNNRGILLAVGPAAETLGRFWILPQADHASPAGAVQLTAGMNLLPDCIVVLQADDAVQPSSNLNVALGGQADSRLNCVEISLQKDTGLVLDGRKLHVFGTGQASVLVAAAAELPQAQCSIAAAQAGQAPSKWLVDLTQWRRMAQERTLEAFPPVAVEIPRVEQGSLVIVGGGGMPPGLMQQFVDLAGGAQHAKLVYVPCSEQDRIPERQSTVQEWKDLGVAHTAVLHTKDRTQANEDEAFLAPLRDATGIWFGGGRQWNFSDSYYGTQAHRLMKEVLVRGGVIGGSSAGASIQAAYLARATPIENFGIMAPGYERGGLGFIRGVAIDQHFSQRGRQRDMSQLVDRYPQLLGIGIDEATAIIVRESTAQVVGRGKVHFYDRTRAIVEEQPDFRALTAGQAYDLAGRKVVAAPIE